jgi:hypothetical protein
LRDLVQYRRCVWRVGRPGSTTNDQPAIV